MGAAVWITSGASMQSSRRIRALGLVLWGLHILVLLVLPPGQAKTLLSDFIQFAIAALVVAACWVAFRRSGYFGRTFWGLATVAFSLLATGLGLGFYYDSLLGEASPHYWVVDMLVNAWVAPLVMCLFLDPETEQVARDWRRLLDFAQVGIVFGLLYLYSTNFVSPGAEFQPWRLVFVTDTLIMLGFLVNGKSMPPGPVRTLFLRFGYFRVVAVLTDLVFVLGMPEPLAGTMFDMVWSLDTVIALLVTTGWQGSGPTAPRLPATMHRRRLIVTQLMPLVFPVFIILIASQITRGQLVVAGVAIFTTLGITYARLLVTHREVEKSAKALRSSNNLLHSIMEGASEAIFVKDLEGRYILMNTPGARSVGRTVDQIIGHDDFALFSIDGAQRVREADQQVIQSGKAQIYEFAANVASVPRTFLTTTSPYLDSDGKVIGVIGVSLDVTDWRKLEEHLRQSQRMDAIGTLSGGIAHDFNNLLTVIKGYARLVLDDVQDPKLRAHIEHIDEASERAASLTRQLLAFGRRQVMQSKVIDLNALVANLGKMLKRLVGEDIRMVIVTEPNLGSVRADPSQIEQVIVNLVVNARDAMPTGGCLTIETATVEHEEIQTREHGTVLPGRYAMLAVSDTGVGMDAETRSRIFEPFFTTKEIGKGTGLGLSTVYGVVNQSGGSIWVYSEPGHGSVFKVYLPIVEESISVSPDKLLTGTSIRGTETVLLVEDDNQVRELARALLAACGYTVLVADSSTAALSVCENHVGVIHLLLTDMIMPGSSGLELANQLTASKPAIKVLFMSGYTNHSVLHRGIVDSGTHFLPKPFTPASLAGKVREILDLSVADS
jgi:PAS domain S-box-containing protein